MSNREKCIEILDSFDEAQLANIAAMLQAAADAIDDAYCSALYAEYEANPDKGEAVSLDEAARMLGVSL